MVASTCRYPVLILCYVIIARSEGASGSKDGTVRVLYIGGPEAVNQAQAAQHYINSKSILPSGYHLQIIGGDSKVCYDAIYMQHGAITSQRVSRDRIQG